MAPFFLAGVILLSQLAQVTALKWIACIEPGESVTANINCGPTGEQIHIIGFDAGRTARWNPDIDAHCRRTQIDQTEDLRTACNGRTSCEEGVLYPRNNLCRWHEGIHYVMVTYECISSQSGSQVAVFDPMATSVTFRGRELVLQSAVYPSMTDTINNRVCSIEIGQHMRVEINVYDLSYNHSGSSQYLIDWNGELLWAERGVKYHQLPDTHTSARLHFRVISTSFRGRFWIKLTAQSDDPESWINAEMSVTCSEDATSDYPMGDLTAPATTSMKNNLTLSDLEGTCLDTSGLPTTSNPTSMRSTTDDSSPRTSATFPPSTMNETADAALTRNLGSHRLPTGAIAGSVLAAAAIVVILLVIIILRSRKKKLSPTSSTTKLEHLENQLNNSHQDCPQNAYEGISTITKSNLMMKSEFENDLLKRSLPTIPGDDTDVDGNKTRPPGDLDENYQDDTEYMKPVAIYEELMVN